MSRNFKSISIVAFATMVSRVLGLGRDMLVAAVFGTAGLASVFYTAFTLPNLFRRLLGEGALTAAFVPTLNEELKAGQRAGAFALVNQVSSWLFVVTGGVVALAMAAFGQARWLAVRAAEWGVEPATVQRWLDAADLTIILFPYLLFVCLAAAFSAALQTLQRFLEPALSPIWLNVSMIVCLGGAVYAGWSNTWDGKMLWLCGGTLLGGFLQMIVPALALVREGWRPRLDFRLGEPMRQILRLMGPTVFGSAIYLINMAVARFIGISLNDSAVAVLNLATRLMELPIGVFTIAISTVIFPLISQYAAAGDWKNLGLAYRKGMRLILVINVPAAVGLAILAEPIVRVLFQRGAFQASDTELTQPVLVVFACGLPFLSFVSMVLRAYYAQKDTRTPVHAALASFLVNLALSLALMGPLGTVGLAVASNLAIVVQAVYLQRQIVRKHESFAFRPLLRDLGKVAAASAVMGLVVAGGWLAWGLVAPAIKRYDLVALLGLVAVGVSVYAGLLWMMKIEGRDDLAAVVAKARAKLGLNGGRNPA